MKKLLSFIACVLTSITMQGHSFEVDGIFYNILSTTSEDSTLKVEVTYEGSSYSAYDEYSGTVVIPETVEYDGNTYTVTQIGNSAFRDCKNLKSIIISRNVTKVNSSAFYNCTSLTSASLPAVTSIGSSAFYDCTSLTSASLPAATSIGGEAFYKCTSLTSASLPAVTSIGSSAFYNCSNISSLRIGSVEQWCSVQLPSSYASWASPLSQSSQNVDLYIGDSETPVTSIEVPSSVTKIPDYAFSGTTITSVSAPSATSIGSSAFSSCSSLTSASLPSATSIGSSAFSHCTSLTSASLPSATSIGDYAFYYCPSLTSASLPAATSIGSYAFCGCESLEKAIMPKVETIGSGAFTSEYLNSTDHYCKALKYVDLSSVKTIGSAAFRYCTSLTSANLPAATSIGSEAFRNCTSLASASLPAATSIGDYAFDSCTSLTSASLPAATSVGSSAFRYCTSLTSANLPAATSIGSVAFCGCESLEEAIMPKVETIGSSAFSSAQIYDGNNYVNLYCKALKYVDLSSVKSIGSSAFSGCSGITSLRIGSVEQWCGVQLPSSAYFASPLYQPSQSVDLYIGESETPATSIEVPSTVTEIPQYAFSGTTITSVSAPSATSIRSYAFSSCSSLTSASLPSATSIGSSAFQNCTSLTSASLPAATSIGSSAFCGCESLEEAIMPKVETIGGKAFASSGRDINGHWIEYGNKLKTLSFPSAISIGDHAFYGNTYLELIHLPANPPSVANTDAFPTWTMLSVPEEAYTSYLTANVFLSIPLQITTEECISKNVEVVANDKTSSILEAVGEEKIGRIVNLTVNGTINSYDMMVIRNKMTSLRNIDLTAASIVDCNYEYYAGFHSEKDVAGPYWFYQSNIMNVKLPANLKRIGAYAFCRSDKLLSVSIPDCVTDIDEYAFYECTNLADIVLPADLVSLGEWSLRACKKMTKINFPSGLQEIKPCTFYDCGIKDLYIPSTIRSMGYMAFNNLNSVRFESLEGWFNTCIEYAGMMGGEYQTQWHSGPFCNIDNIYFGNDSNPTETLVIPDNITVIDDARFQSFHGIKEVVLHGNVKEIGPAAFYDCIGLEKIDFPNSLETIGESAFIGCVFNKVELPAYLKSIGHRAFKYCRNLKEVLIPASMEFLGNEAFIGCSNLNKIIATTVEPISINQQTFSTYKTAKIYTPKTSYYNYYWDTQWSQFLSVNEYDKEYGKTFGYKYFYINDDFTISDAQGTIHGEKVENSDEEIAPDADFNEGAGMIVGGEQVQELGDIHIHHNGNNGASVITKQNGKVHIDNLYVDIKTQKNRWYFFCFPFDIQPGEASFDGSHVWYLYDGEARAQNGNGGWKKVASDGVMKAGNGYIFQGAVNGTLTIHVQNVTIDGTDAKTNMITYASDNKNDASWNLIGNPSMAYYDMDNLGYDAPITVYDNNTGNYEAVRPGDDQYEFYPFQAFFVQKPEGVDALNFEADKKETKNMADKKKPAASGAKAKAKAIAMRKVINLEIVAADEANDSVAAPTDRTRIVVNPMKTTAYEPECDAAKFIADGMPQIYSLDNDGSKYAINERPVEDGIIALAVKADKEGIYTISAPRLDCAAKLRDLDAETEVDLAEGGYTFMAEAKTYTNRFQLILGSNIATGITTPEEAQAAISVEAGAINIADSNADVKVYTVSGSLVASQKGAGTVSVPAGTYVVNVNGQSIKVNVNE